MFIKLQVWLWYVWPRRVMRVSSLWHRKHSCYENNFTLANVSFLLTVRWDQDTCGASAELLCSLAALQTLGSWTNGLTGTCPHSSLSLPDKSHPCWNVSHCIWNSLDCCVVYHDKQINQKPHWEEMWATFRKNGDEKFGLFSLLLTSQKSVIHGDSLAFWSPVLNKKSWRGSNKTWWGTLLWDPLKSGVIFGQRFQGFLTLFF